MQEIKFNFAQNYLKSTLYIIQNQMVEATEIVSFDKLKKEKPFLLVDFYADWCESCKMLDDILNEIQKKMGEKIFIHKIDVGVSKELAQKYHVMSVPALILCKNGEQVWRMNGFLLANELIKTFEKFLND